MDVLPLALLAACPPLKWKLHVGHFGFGSRPPNVPKQETISPNVFGFQPPYFTLYQYHFDAEPMTSAQGTTVCMPPPAIAARRFCVGSPSASRLIKGNWYVYLTIFRCGMVLRVLCSVPCTIYLYYISTRFLYTYYY